MITEKSNIMQKEGDFIARKLMLMEARLKECERLLELYRCRRNDKDMMTFGNFVECSVETDSIVFRDFVDAKGDQLTFGSFVDAGGDKLTFGSYINTSGNSMTFSNFVNKTTSSLTFNNFINHG